MDKKIWLNKMIKNRDINDYSTNKDILEQLFYKLKNYSINNNQNYIDHLDEQTNFLINDSIINDFINFCYINSDK